MTVMRVVFASLFLLAVQVASQSQIVWPAFNGGGSRSGINSKETAISQSTVKNLVSLWTVTLPDVVDSSPVFLPGVSTPNGTFDLLFFTSRNAQFWAVDAATGNIIWRAANTTGSGVSMSSPAIDPSLKYVYSYRQDGKVHKYDVGTGAEVTGLGFPATITLILNVEKGSSSINIASGYLYITISGYIGDAGHYDGHVVAVRLSDGLTTVFNILCSDKRELLGSDSTKSNYCAQAEAGVWGRAGAVEDPDDGSIYIVSGNGLFNADQTGGTDYGDSIVRLRPGVPNASNVLLDSYTPVNASKLQSEDLDLGSVSTLILPIQSKSKTPYMIVQAGKDQVLRLVNRRDLSGQGGPGHVGGELQIIALQQGCICYGHPLAWENPADNVTWVFIANGCGFSAYTLSTDGNGVSTLKNAYVNKSLPGSSPFVANNVLFLQSTNTVVALVPTTGAVLWTGTTNGLHWQSPIVVNGKVFLADQNRYGRAFGFK